MTEITSDLETEFTFQQKVTDYVNMTGKHFFELVELSLEPHIFNLLVIHLERETDAFIKKLKEKEVIFNKMDEIISQGVKPIIISADGNTYTSKISSVLCHKELSNYDVHPLDPVDEICYYRGLWKNLKPNGNGKLILKNGGCYEGNFVNGTFEGMGKYVCSDGAQYEGNFANNNYNGQGCYTTDTLYYNGNFVDDDYQGHGEYIRDGDYYEGEFDNDTYHGQGMKINLDGSYYEGIFSYGKYHGHGILIHSNGDQYEGDFKNGLMSGIGKYIYQDNSKIEGDFIDDRFILPNSSLIYL